MKRPMSLAELDESPTLPRVLRAAAAAHGDREFLVSGKRRFSYAETERASAELARGLLALGLGKGGRVGVMMPNDVDWALAWFAAGRIGTHTIPLSTFYKAPELDWAIRHNDIDTLLVSAAFLNNDFLEQLERALPGLTEQKTPVLYLRQHPYLRRIIVWGACDRSWALRGPEALLAHATAMPQIDDPFLKQVEAAISPADSLITICTSGTTAEPKAVVHTHGSAIRATLRQTEFYRIDADDRIYLGMPFFWVGGHNYGLFPVLYTGACLCFAPTPRPADIVRVIERERVTRLHLWPAQAQGVREQAERDGGDLSSVTVGLGTPRDASGQEIPPDRRSGGAMGMTETFGPHSIEAFNTAMPEGKGGAWGRALRGVERKIVDPDTGRPVPPGDEGELYVRSATLMQGYYKKERAETFAPDGYFRTGDLARIDADGYIYFTGRGGEMIKTAGANVAPKEVEAVLQAHLDVREAIVFGIPDAIKGEIVVAVVVPTHGAQISEAALRSYARENLSPYKVPQILVFAGFEEVPRTGSQKPRKALLRDLLPRLQARSKETSAPVR